MTTGLQIVWLWDVLRKVTAIEKIRAPSRHTVIRTKTKHTQIASEGSKVGRVRCSTGSTEKADDYQDGHGGDARLRNCDSEETHRNPR